MNYPSKTYAKVAWENTAYHCDKLCDYVIPEAHWYDYILVNEIIEESADDLLCIIRAELSSRRHIEYKIDEVLATYGKEDQND